MFRTTVVQKIKTYFVFNNFFGVNACLLRGNVEKRCRVEQVTEDNMAQANFILDT
jgi:hypothetical protein